MWIENSIWEQVRLASSAIIRAICGLKFRRTRETLEPPGNFRVREYDSPHQDGTAVKLEQKILKSFDLMNDAKKGPKKAIRMNHPPRSFNPQ